MAQTVYYTGSSLDGFIADEQNSLDWLTSQPTPPGERFDRFLAGVGALVMGRTTYEWVFQHEDLQSNPERWAAFYGDRPTWVFSHRDLPTVPGAPMAVAQGDVGTYHPAIVAAAADRDVWLVGGGDLVGQFADLGLLDRVVVGVAPVTLGAGAPLLPRALVGRLTLTDVERDGVFAYLTYQVG